MHLEVLIIDDHRAFSEALAVAIDMQPDLACAGCAADLDDAGRKLDQHEVDLVVLGGSHAAHLELIDQLRSRYGIRVVVLADDDAPDLVMAADQAGASGFVSKAGSIEDVLVSIRSARDGRLLVDGGTVVRLLEHDRSLRLQAPPPTPTDPLVTLTPRERDVLALLAEGRDPQQIARELVMSIHTARGHVKSILMKLGAHSQLEAVVTAARGGLLPGWQMVTTPQEGPSVGGRSPHLGLSSARTRP